MKTLIKLLFIYIASVLVISCSSGSTSSDTPPNLSGNAFTGTFQNNDGNDSGTISFNLTQNSDGKLTGLVIINNSSCLQSGSLDSASSLSGFNANISVAQPSGTLVFALTAANNRLSGSYTVTGLTTTDSTTNSCTNSKATGTVTVSR